MILNKGTVERAAMAAGFQWVDSINIHRCPKNLIHIEIEGETFDDWHPTAYVEASPSEIEEYEFFNLVEVIAEAIEAHDACRDEERRQEYSGYHTAARVGSRSR
jgi:hypothetical protein